MLANYFARLRDLVLVLGMTIIFGGDLRAQAPDTPFRFGYSQRMRIETWDNTTSFDQDAGAGNSYFRNRTSFWASWFPKQKIELTARLTNEFKYYFVPENRHFNWDEVFFELLYIKLDSASIRPYMVTLGRQNLFLGEGFIVADGGPLDGSRSAYFNALRLDYFLGASNRFTLFGVYQPEKDKLLPVINTRDRALVEEDHDGAGLYWTGKLSSYSLEAYWIHKNVYHGEHRALLPESRLNCLGGRAVIPLRPQFSIIAEGAFQFGKTDSEKHEAVGGYAYGSYETGWPLKFRKIITLGYIYLGGDDLYSGKDEGWDPMFARWPKWSESYIYSFIPESRVAYWTNLRSFFFKTSVDITPDLNFNFDYHYMQAPAGYRGVIPENYIEKNARRGDLFIGRINYKFDKNISGHVLWESFKPGNFYNRLLDDHQADDYSWARMELMLTF